MALSHPPIEFGKRLRIWGSGTTYCHQAGPVFDMSRAVYLASGFFILQGIQAIGFIDRLMYGEWLGKPGDKITQGLNLLLIAANVFLFSRGMRRIGSIRIGALLALGLAGLYFGSASWSIDNQISIREAVLYLLVIMGAIGIATNLDADEYMDLAASMVFLTAVASLVVLVVLPAAAHSEDGADFRGVFTHKNILGQAMTLGALASLHGLRRGAGRRSRNLVFLATFIILAIMSKSATSCLTIVTFCAADAVLLLFRRGGSGRVFAIGIVALLLPVIVLGALFPDAPLEMIGKDPTLTGRTEIWKYVILDIYERPLVGWGYCAFWSLNNPAALEISDLLHWFAPEAHNGMLEILLNVGFIGAAYIVFLWARTVFVAVRCMKISDQTVAISCLLSCAGILLVGISETVLIDPFEASTSLFFIVGFFCEKALRAPRLRPSWLNMPVANAAVGGRPFLTPRVELPRAGRRPSNRFR